MRSSLIRINMERKILFKAKKLDTKEWVQGFLVPNRMGEGMSIEVFNYKNEWCGAYFVDPSTVCQYTGLKDADGQMLWEHDVVDNVPNYSLRCEIKYEEGDFRVTIRNIENREICSIPLWQVAGINGCRRLYSKFDR